MEGERRKVTATLSPICSARPTPALGETRAQLAFSPVLTPPVPRHPTRRGTGCQSPEGGGVNADSMIRHRYDGVVFDPTSQRQRATATWSPTRGGGLRARIAARLPRIAARLPRAARHCIGRANMSSRDEQSTSTPGGCLRNADQTRYKGTRLFIPSSAPAPSTPGIADPTWYVGSYRTAARHSGGASSHSTRRCRSRSPACAKAAPQPSHAWSSGWCRQWHVRHPANVGTFGSVLRLAPYTDVHAAASSTVTGLPAACARRAGRAR